MALKLYGMFQSSCTRRVLITLAEKKVTDYELIIVNLPLGEQRNPSYLEKAPFGKVPLLDDDGFLIYESRAICQYIARKYSGQGTKLMPDERDLMEYGLFEQVRRVALGMWERS
jgi:glutathione S-transferase